VAHRLLIIAPLAPPAGVAEISNPRLMAWLLEAGLSPGAR